MSADNLRIADTPAASADECSAFVLQTLSAVLQKQERATFAISGGTTPKLLFANLAKSEFEWSRVHFFWVDERCVPPDDDQSNFKLANEALFLPAKVPHSNIHRIHGELTPEEGAIGYIEAITSFFALPEKQLPVFDLLHRGIGPDAHTASLFPGDPLIANETGIAAAVWVEKLRSHRVTLLPGVLQAARHTVLQVAGADKAEPVYQVLNGPDDPLRYPCQVATRGSDRAVWFLDKAAAARL